MNWMTAEPSLQKYSENSYYLIGWPDQKNNGEDTRMEMVWFLKEKKHWFSIRLHHVMCDAVTCKIKTKSSWHQNKTSCSSITLNRTITQQLPVESMELIPSSIFFCGLDTTNCSDWSMSSSRSHLLSNVDELVLLGIGWHQWSEEWCQENKLHVSAFQGMTHRL